MEITPLHERVGERLQTYLILWEHTPFPPTAPKVTYGLIRTDCTTEHMICVSSVNAQNMIYIVVCSGIQSGKRNVQYVQNVATQPIKNTFAAAKK